MIRDLLGVLIVPPRSRSREKGLAITGNLRCRQIGVRVRLGVVICGHFVSLAVPSAFSEVVSDNQHRQNQQQHDHHRQQHARHEGPAPRAPRLPHAHPGDGRQNEDGIR